MVAYPLWLNGRWYFHSSRIRRLPQSRLYTTFDNSSMIDARVPLVHLYERADLLGSTFEPTGRVQVITERHLQQVQPQAPIQARVD